MKLDQYIDISDLNYSAAARQLEVTPQAVRSWCLGERRPTDEFMTKIYKWSQGQVTPNDFYDLPAAEVVPVAQHSDDEGASSSLSPCSGAGTSKACPGHGLDLPFMRAAV